MKHNLVIFSRMKKIYRILILAILVITLILSIYYFNMSISQPEVFDDKIIENSFTETIDFSYQAIVNPSTLYPNGGRVVPDGIIFTKITDKIIINMNYSLESEAPVSIDGNIRASLNIIAKDMWNIEKELVPLQSVKSEGNLNPIIQDEIYIDIKDVLTLIKQVEEEILARPSNYMMVVRTFINGDVFDHNGAMIYQLAETVEIPFMVGEQQISFAGDLNLLNTVKKNTVERSNPVQNKINILGIQVPVTDVRLISACIGLLTLVVLTVGLAKSIKSSNKNKTEESTIDKKLGSRIIKVYDKTAFNGLIQLRLPDINSVMQIAEEKEEPVFKFIDDFGHNIYYCVLNNLFAYYYSIPIKPVESAEKANENEDAIAV
ncbi:MAG: DUF5305 domain-containing protein [Clostridiaceae bacterium]|nr:DUF5305 domain-containing protein [Clostridiaceae bacterium]